MIPPQEQWCVEIDVTNACPRKCANCTRLVSHAKEPFFMSIEQFTEAAEALVEFPTNGAPDRYMQRRSRPSRQRAVGIMGGEPLIHPEFPKLCEILTSIIPNKGHRGVLTAIPLDGHKYESLIRKTFRFINENTHQTAVVHQPGLVAIQDVAPHAVEVQAGKTDAETWMWEWIDRCWLQELWSSAITPKGFFFCEIAAAMDMIMDGPGGLPVTEACWQHDIAEYRHQAELWCPRCGICLPLPGRKDADEHDDVSQTNLTALRRAGSPRILCGAYHLFAPDSYDAQEFIGAWQPEWYMR